MQKRLAFRQKYAILITLYYEVTKKVMDSYVAKQESAQLDTTNVDVTYYK